MTPEGRPVDQVIRRIRELPQLSADSLDAVEFVTDLEEEFGAETVNRALLELHFLSRPKHPEGSPRKPSQSPGPLWDRELDG
jgi:hypothetical protein